MGQCSQLCIVVSVAAIIATAVVSSSSNLLPLTADAIHTNNDGHLATSLLKVKHSNNKVTARKGSDGNVAATDPQLPSSIRFNPNTLTVSGISAGGAMAVQFQYAFSRIVKGAAIIAGAPYMCAQGLIQGALDCMNLPFQINEAILKTDIATFQATGLIDGISNIHNHTIFLFSGTKDTVVNPGTMAKVEDMMKYYQPYSLRSMFNYSAEHSWVTNYFGNACDFLGEPYLNNCGVDFAGEFLSQSFRDMTAQGNINPANNTWNPNRGTYAPLNLVAFDQTAYGASVLISMDSVGYVYVPLKCATGAVECHLHVNFHGCNQQRTKVGTEYVEHTGLNEWGEANNIVILYPQIYASDLVPLNPQGCFDWWGYAGDNYAVKDGPQMQVVRKMIAALGHF